MSSEPVIALVPLSQLKSWRNVLVFMTFNPYSVQHTMLQALTHPHDTEFEQLCDMLVCKGNAVSLPLQ